MNLPPILPTQTHHSRPPLHCSNNPGFVEFGMTVDGFWLTAKTWKGNLSSQRWTMLGNCLFTMISKAKRVLLIHISALNDVAPTSALRGMLSVTLILSSLSSFR
jgi:hypothetical protein